MASNAEWKQQSEKYIADRIQDQISWYERKSRINKTGYYRCRYLIIGSGALIPLLVGYAEGWFDWLKYVAGFLGVVVAISEGIMSLKKFLENWSTYRLTAERLRRAAPRHRPAALLPGQGEGVRGRGIHAAQRAGRKPCT